MGAKGKLVVGQEFFPSKGDIFHQLLKNNPHAFSTSSPQIIQGCVVHEGEFGKPGSVIFWNYTHDGKERVAKEVIEAVDDEKKLISLRVIGGDILDEYKEFLLTFHVEESNDGKELATWTFEYETLNDDVGPPFSLIQLAFAMIVDVEKAQP
ncbi:hypothetical protein M569_15558 [Genlisea aurea]|uniref:Bet v I/Major latex protein domain-containing protein n=1 Tax=Genlisea aurea TaxID=192259 RepID=S8DIJ2_9LAMI|nr:hypothetical protein M569_15558 [Genlisea aurea]